MDKKISELNVAGTLATTDTMVLVQGSSTNRIDVDTFFGTVPRRIVVKEVPEALTTSGAISTTKLYTKLTANTTVYTLAAGTHGMEKIIVCNVLTASTAVITVTGGAGFTTVTMNAVGDAVKLVNIDSIWYIVGQNSVVVA